MMPKSYLSHLHHGYWEPLKNTDTQLAQIFEYWAVIQFVQKAAKSKYILEVQKRILDGSFAQVLHQVQNIQEMFLHTGLNLGEIKKCY